MTNPSSKLETALFWIMTLAFAGAGAVLIVEGFPWPNHGPLIDMPILSGFDSLSFHTGITLAAVHVFTIILASMGLAAIAFRQITMTSILLFIPLVALSHAIDLVRFGVLFMAAVILALSWIWPRPTSLRNTPAHIAIGAALLTLSLLQGLTHAGLLMPSFDVRDARLQEVGALIDESQNPAELNRWAALGFVPLEPVTADSLPDVLRQASAPETRSAIEAFEQTLDEAPRDLHHWILQGWQHRWRMLLVYDGRGEAPQAWRVPMYETYAPTVDAMAQIALMTGLTGPIWGLLILILLRRQAASPEPSEARRSKNRKEMT